MCVTGTACVDNIGHRPPALRPPCPHGPDQGWVIGSRVGAPTWAGPWNGTDIPMTATVSAISGRCESAWEGLRHCHGCSESGLASHFGGSSWGSVGQGLIGRESVRLARSGTGEKSRQPGGRRPMVLDSFSSDGSQERSELVEGQVSLPEQRRWSFLPFPL